MIANVYSSEAVVMNFVKKLMNRIFNPDLELEEKRKAKEKKDKEELDAAVAANGAMLFRIAKEINDVYLNYNKLVKIADAIGIDRPTKEDLRKRLCMIENLNLILKETKCD